MFRPLLADLVAVSRSRATVKRDLVYEKTGTRALKLDLYLPKTRPVTPPVVLCIHGGGWCSGDRTQCPNWMLANHGYAVAAIEYRFAKEAAFPAQLRDCQAGVRWLRENAGRYHFDATRIGAWGHSSGGHLAALLGVSGDVQAVCAISTPTDLGRMYRESIVNPLSDPRVPQVIEALLGGSIETQWENARAASPIHYVSSTSAPFLLIHGAKDRTVPVNQSEIFAAALRQAGVSSTLKIFPHGRHSPGSLNRSGIIKEFYDQHLRG